MSKKLAATLAALVMAAVVLVPTSAEARDTTWPTGRHHRDTTWPTR